MKQQTPNTKAAGAAEPAKCLRCAAAERLSWLYIQLYVTDAENDRIRARIYRKSCGCPPRG